MTFDEVPPPDPHWHWLRIMASLPDLVISWKEYPASLRHCGTTHNTQAAHFGRSRSAYDSASLHATDRSDGRIGRATSRGSNLPIPGTMSHEKCNTLPGLARHESAQETAKIMRKPPLVHITWLHVQDRLSVNPWIFLPLSKVRPSLHGSEDPARAVSRKTEIVIEGFPRSGNTFAVVAFRQAQQRKVEIAHHLHAGAQIKRAAKLGLPAIVLIREPSDAVLSVAAKDQDVSISWALSSYIRFYSAVLPHLDKAVVAPFANVTSDFAGVIRQVNVQYGTNFREFVPSEDALYMVQQSVERLGHQDSIYTGRDYRLSVGFPTEERQRAKEARRTEYLDEHNKLLRVKAESIYHRIWQASAV